MSNYLYGNFYQRQALSLTMARSGGLNRLAIQEALVMVSGRPLLGAPAPLEPLRVCLMLNESRVTLMEQIQPCMDFMGLANAEVSGRLTVVASTPNTPASILRMADSIVERKIDVLIVNPASCADEKDAFVAADCLSAWAGLALQTNSSISFIQGLRQGGGERGTSHLVNVCGAVRSLDRADCFLKLSAEPRVKAMLLDPFADVA